MPDATELRAMVLRTVDYREADRVLTLLTPDAGKRTVTARGCRRMKSPLLSLAQPFVVGDFVLRELKGKWTLAGGEIVESFYDLRLDYERLSVASLMAGAIEDSALVYAEGDRPPDGEEAGLYALLYRSLAHLCYGNTEAMDLLLLFIVKLCALLGWRLKLSACAQCGRPYPRSATSALSRTRVALHMEAGGLLCSACARNLPPERLRRVSTAALEALQDLQALDPEDKSAVEALALSPELRGQLARVLEPYLSAHAERRLKVWPLLEPLL